jgi:nucleotide-binding universal stress UspA family protein
MLAGTILVATDFGEHAERATQYAVELARRLEARVCLVHAYTLPILGPPSLSGSYLGALAEQLEKDARRELDAALERHKTPGVHLSGLVKQSDPRQAVIEAARDLDADLVVLGTHGRHGLKRVVMGSVAEFVVRHAPCPVLAVRQKGSSE